MRRRKAYDVEGDGERNNFEIMQLYLAATIHRPTVLSFLVFCQDLATSEDDSPIVLVRQEPSDAAVLSHLTHHAGGFRSS